MVPEAADYGVVPLDERVRGTVEIRNESSGPSSLTVVGVELAADPGFGIDDADCVGRTLATGESCEITVIFSSTVAGSFGGQVTASFAEVPSQSSTFTVTASSGPSSTTGPPQTTTLPPPTTGGPATTSPPATTNVPASTGPDTVPTPTTTPGVGPSAAEVADCQNRAARAEVSFPPSLAMTVGVESMVEVSVAVGGAELPPPSAGTAGPSTTVVPTELTCFVVATLTGTPFDIEDEEKTGDFLRSSSLTWTWDVTPREAGSHDLSLEITPRWSFQGVVQSGTPRPFRADIEVVGASKSGWDRFTGWLASVVDFPLVRGAGSLVAVVGALAACWKWVLRRPWPWVAAGVDNGEVAEEPAVDAGEPDPGEPDPGEPDPGEA